MSSLSPQGWAVFECSFHHKYTCDGGGCQAEYVWGTCMDCMPLKPWYLQHPVSLAEVESVKVGTYRVRVYPPQFHRFVGAYSVTNTHVSVVVVRQNMHEVPVWTGIRDTSSIEGVWRELRAWTLNFDLIIYTESYKKCWCEFSENIQTCDFLVLLLSNRLPERYVNNPNSESVCFGGGTSFGFNLNCWID